MTLLSTLKPTKGSTHRKKIIGRGNASGHGGTSTKGHKGQKSRSGPPPYLGFEGGQMPLHRRSPKWGFNNYNHRTEYSVVNLDDLDRVFTAGDQVDLEACLKKGLVKSKTLQLKVLGRGKLTKALKLKVAKISETAKKSIEAVKGTVELLNTEKAA